MTRLEAYARALLLAAEALATTERVPDLPGGLLDEGDPFAWLCVSAGLSMADAQVLALLVGVELDPTCQEALAGRRPGASRRVTLRVLQELFPAPHPGVLCLAPDAALRRAALVDVQESEIWSERTVRVQEGVLWSLLGDSSLDPVLAVGTWVRGGGATAPVPGLRVVSGGDIESRRQALLRAGAGVGLLVVPTSATHEQWAAAVREATLRALMVVGELDGSVPSLLCHWVERARHLPWGLSSPHELPLDQLPRTPWQELVLDHVHASAEDWAQAGLRPPEGVSLDREQLRLVARARTALSDGRSRGTAGADAHDAVRRLAGGHLDRLTRRVRPRRGWPDLVLAPELHEAVQDLVARHRQRGRVFDEWGFDPGPSRGTVALMSGPSGTGKTLSAEVIAGDLGLDLFVLDLSSVVSKYIGETEKNLSAVFDAAERGDAVLFFDEADALFGRRSTVTDARDRYANVEVSYLLQRLERHDGLVLLATNLPSNIDEAFTRRFHAHLQFRPPDVAERRRLWLRAFPPASPAAGVDVDLLAATVELSGGSIASASLNAAFAAAEADVPIDTALVLRAVQAEYRKQGRLLDVLPVP